MRKIKRSDWQVVSAHPLSFSIFPIRPSLDDYFEVVVFFVCFLFEKIFLLEKLLEKSCTLQEGNQTLPAWEQLQPLLI